MKPSPLILCDRGEERSGLPQRLERQGCIVDIDTLASGDYLVSAAFAVERKAGGDFSASVLSGRLRVQLETLSRSYEYGALLIEGDSWEGNRSLRTPMVGELYHWISLQPNLTVIYSPSLAYTARLLTDLARREQSVRVAATAALAPRHNAKARTAADILCAFPGVGTAGARRLLDRFGTIGGVTRAAEDELQQTIGQARGSALHAAFNETASADG